MGTQRANSTAGAQKGGVSPGPGSTPDYVAESSSQSPSQAPAIALPTGGGAIRGIDEKLQVNPATGSAAMTVPIATSPARQGFGPQLTLSYDSGSGSGPFGLGWSLSLPQITRQTSKGLPTYQDGKDVFILSGTEELVPMLEPDGQELVAHSQMRTLDGEPYLVQRYRPRIEGLFARIEQWTSQQTGESHWRSIARNNVTTLYGRTSESRIADPDDALRVFSWLICESHDDKGNAIVYRYQAEDSANVDRSQLHERNRTDDSRQANRYPKRIQYGNQTPSQPGEDVRERDDWLFEVVFDYEEGHFQPMGADAEGRQFASANINPQQPWLLREDALSSYRAAFEVRTYRLCRRVLMFHHFPNELGHADCLVGATHFGYVESPINSLMTNVVASRYLRHEDGVYLERSLPAVEFDFSRAEIQSQVHEIDGDSLENLPAGLADSRYRWVDLDGEGISGILTEQSDGWFYKENLGNGHFAPLQPVATQPSMAALSSGQQLIDLAGDGQLDLVKFEAPAPGFYERTHERSWADHQAFTQVPSIDWSDPNLRFVDLTGDGHADVLVTEDQVLTWYPSLGEEGFASSQRRAYSDDEEAGPRLIVADATQSIYLADMNGDGLTDLVRIRNGSVCYWPNLGYGRFGPKVSMDHAPWFDAPDQFEQRRIRLADVDGSGITDILYLQGNHVAIHFNQAGNSWSPTQFVRQFPRVDNVSDVTVTDLLGNGTACLVWSSPLPGEMGRQLRYIDLMGGQKPHLMIGFRNQLGAETRLRYAPSTKFYLEDKAAGRPWITRLPFPVHVVERSESYDHVSRNRFVSRYSYHHGYFDGVEREFRGFGMVEQTDTEEFAALIQSDAFPDAVNLDEASHTPPVVTRSWFHTGVYFGRRRVSSYFAGLRDERDSGEYYREPGLSDDEAAELLLPDTTLPAGLTAHEEREACRALKGVLLRQEVYAEDGTDQATHPYTVTEQDYTIKLLQPRGPNRHAVFFSHPRESISYHYERQLVEVDGELATDPRISHAVTLATDEFGNVLQSVAIGYGRRRADETLSEADQARQRQSLITCSENDFTNAVEEDDAYRSPLPSEIRTYEVTGLELAEGQTRFSFSQLKQAVASPPELALPYHATPSPGTLQKRILEQARTLYRPDDFGASAGSPDTLLPLGQLQSLALSVRAINWLSHPNIWSWCLGIGSPTTC